MAAVKMCEGERCVIRQKARQLIEEKKRLRPSVTVNAEWREFDERGGEFLVGSLD